MSNEKKNYHASKNAFGKRDKINKGKCGIMTCNLKRNKFLFGPDTKIDKNSF